VGVLIAVLCTGALLLIVLIASGSDIDENSARAIGTASAIAFFGLTGAAGTNLARRRPELAWFGQLSAATAAIALLTMVGSIWSDGLSGDSWKPAVYTLIFAFATGHASVLLAAANDDENARLVRNGTLLALALLVVLAFAEIASPGRDVGAQPIGVIAVLYVLGTIVLALLRRTSPSAPQAPTANVPGARATGLPRDHLCLAWEGSVEAAVEHLRLQGVEAISAPVPSVGGRGQGQSVYYHDADGSLIELIAYG